MIKKRWCSLILAFVVAFIAGCGGYGRQASSIVPTSLAVTPMESSQPIGADRQFLATLTFSDNRTRESNCAGRYDDFCQLQRSWSNSNSDCHSPHHNT